MRDIVVIAHDLRSTHNVGSLLRTCEGLGVAKVYLTGYTPYPLMEKDERLPHLAQKIDQQISKTALGAQTTQAWEHAADIEPVLKSLAATGYAVVALEQSPTAIPLPGFKPPEKIAIILGSEVDGLAASVLSLASAHLEIPMFGRKESFNVVQAAAMALYHCRFAS